MDLAHEPVRIWWAPWRHRCRCGARRWPCPDTMIESSPPPAYWLSLHNRRAHWTDDGEETQALETWGEQPNGAEPTGDPPVPTQDRNRQSRQRRWQG